MCKKTLAETIQRLVVNDYFTPNIKAEVILDTLLTPYITQIVSGRLGEQAGKLTWLTKEMSIPENGVFGSNGAKVDYVLAGSGKVYLVELKTTDSSTSALQAENYLDICQGQKFGDILGRQLLTVLSNKKRTFFLDLGSLPWCDAALTGAFETIAAKSFDRFSLLENEGKQRGRRAETAKKLILGNQWAQRKKYSSRKYL